MRELKQSTAANIAVFMTSSTDHVSGATGLTLTITASKDSAAFASITPTVTELANGWYNLALTTTHTNTLGDLAIHITSTGADATDFVSRIIAMDKTVANTPANVIQVNGTAQTAGDIPARLPAALTANGNIKSSVMEFLTTALTETAGQIAAAFKKLFDVASPVLTAASVNQTGDNFPRLGAPAGASIAADIAEIEAETDGIASIPTSNPSAAAIAAAVWQDTTAGDFTVAGSIGKSLFTSGALPGAPGGLLIAGSNAATTFATLTSTGAFTVNGSNVSTVASGWFGATIAPAITLLADKPVYSDLGTTLATDGATVEQWNDQSGNGLNATQTTSANRPVYVAASRANGLPAIRFDGNTNANVALTLPNGLSIDRQNCTIFVVGRTIAARNLNGVLALGSSPVLLVYSSDTYGSTGAFYGIGLGGGDDRQPTQPIAPAENMEVLCIQSSATNCAITYNGGAPKFITALTAGTLTGGTIGNLSATFPFTGEIQAIVVFPARLSEPDRQAVYSTLSARYVTKPYTTQVVFGIESNMSGINGLAYGNSMPAQLLSKGLIPKSTKCVNLGSPGTPYNTLTGILAASYLSLISKDDYGVNGNIVVLSDALNDVNAGRTALQVQADITTACAAIRAAGGKGILVQAINAVIGAGSGVWTSGKQAILDTINAWIMSTGPTIADAVVATPTALLDASNLTNFQSDGFHLTVTGLGLWAQAIAPSINYLVGLATGVSANVLQVNGTLQTAGDIPGFLNSNLGIAASKIVSNGPVSTSGGVVTSVGTVLSIGTNAIATASFASPAPADLQTIKGQTVTATGAFSFDGLTTAEASIATNLDAKVSTAGSAAVLDATASAHNTPGTIGAKINAAAAPN